MIFEILRIFASEIVSLNSITHLMKRTLLAFGSALLLCVSASGQGTVTLTTAAEPGTKIKFLPNAVSATTPVSIDFGDGIVQKYTVDPKLSDWQRWIEAEIKGSTITISGNVTELTMSDARLTSAKIDGMAKLTKLDLSDNEISDFEFCSIMPVKVLSLDNNKIENSPSYNATLSLEYVGETLERLNIAHNKGLQCLDMRYLSVLEDLQAYECPDLASVFICLPEETREFLKYINLSNCSLAHFYPVNLPSLRSLDLSGNLLMTEYDDEPFSMGNYPNLRNLTLSRNKGIKSVDISECPYLEQLYIDGCNFSSINLSSNPELLVVNIANNKIANVDFSNNKNLSTVLIHGNPITELDMELLPNVNTLNISDTKISRIDLMQAYFLKSFKASGTLLEFVDFNGLQAERMTVVDLRNCPNFTHESMAYTVRTLPVARKSYTTNLFLEGSNAEKADIDFVTGSDMQWVCDITGDGSAEHSPLSITYGDAVKTGEKKTGTLERLYRYSGLSLDYDLEVMHTDGGDFVVAQWKPVWFQTIKDATDGTVLKGVPVCVYTYPEAGKRFKSLSVNGKEIKSPWFILSEDADVKVNFADELSYITLSVAQGQEMSLRVNTVENNGTVWIDWGTGGRSEYTGQRGYVTAGNELVGSRIDGKAAGATVTIYGEIAGLDINGFGDVAADFGLWDNHVTAIDVTHAPDLKILTAYWNPIESIDLSKNTLLEFLDLSYTAVSELDLSNCPNLMSLEAYSSGLEEEGMKALRSVDLSKLPILQLLNLKNNKMESIDLSHNPYLRWVDLCGNSFTTINLSANTIIEELNLMNNKLTALDASMLTALRVLDVDKNELTGIDLSKNTELRTLMLGNNYIKDLDLSMLTHLQTLYINGNGLNAGQINDIFYRLPIRTEETADGSMRPNWNLCIYQSLDREANDYEGHDSSIAIDRGWQPSHHGSNSGCQEAYLDLLTAIHGSYTVSDAAGNNYVHGSKVEKWLPLTINATPESGYRMHSYRLNDDDAVIGSDSFEMPGVYTKLRVEFAKTSGIDAAENGGISVRAVRGGVEISVADGKAADVAVYSTSGALIASDSIESTRSYSLAPGFYIVKAGSTVRTVAVK